ncbi:hypothetical protein [Bianquea renquensis]|uniref:Uncharacterized protein n=1 Tax=Bianquea renquensis TaxID=2763661 RepID=A0A926DV33_9FIRM|nr:hypothetical protein [Bianquea renquensis]MBC8544377.1 hypothetical protein [Bianquea renquensis]
MKNARRQGEERHRPAGTRRLIPRRHSRNDLAGGDTERKMHAGEVKNASGQRAHEDIFSAATGETILPAEIQNDKCTPAR